MTEDCAACKFETGFGSNKLNMPLIKQWMLDLRTGIDGIAYAPDYAALGLDNGGSLIVEGDAALYLLKRQIGFNSVEEAIRILAAVSTLGGDTNVSERLISHYTGIPFDISSQLMWPKEIFNDGKLSKVGRSLLVESFVNHIPEDFIDVVQTYLRVGHVCWKERLQYVRDLT